MAAPQDDSKLTGGALAQDLFEDMGRKVEGMNLNGSDDTDDTTMKTTDEIESMCMNCHDNGMTRLLLTKIPYFKEIVISSFTCDHCGFKNSEIQSAGRIQEKGSKYRFKVEDNVDMQRRVVKGETCIFRVEDIDLEVPAGKGQFTTIEGIVTTVRDDLDQHQEARMEQMPEVAKQVGGVIDKLTKMIDGESFPFTVTADDPSGNSWIEPSPRDTTAKYKKDDYKRTAAQNAIMGIGDEVPEPSTQSQAPETEIRPEYQATGMVGSTPMPERQGNNVDDEDIVENEVYSFPAHCPGCTQPCDTHMKMVNIPYFKKVVLMSTSCDSCGYRSNEVKSGGEVPEKGQKITLKVKNSEDMSRDILKSEWAALEVPELEMHVQPGTMGGRFTTVEGLLTQIRRDLRAQVFDLSDGDSEKELQRAGDSMAPETKRTWDQFFESLTEAIEGKKEFTVIIDDPLASSYVQSFTAPEPDPQIETVEYERSEEENEELGLADIKTDGYEKDEKKDEIEGGVEEATVEEKAAEKESS